MIKTIRGGATGVLARPTPGAGKMNGTNKGRAARIAAKAAALFCAAAVVLLARPATAAELAILRNGFSIRHEHRLVMGTATRLFLAADDSSFTDVPTAEITGYEKDLSLPLPLPTPADSSTASPSVKSTPALPLNQVVDTASAA